MPSMYNASGQFDKDELVMRFLPLVKRIAYHTMARLPACVMVEDLIQNGTLGLLESLERYEETAGAQFETYASIRIRGAMIDGLRENDHLPKALRREFRKIEEAIAQLEQTFGRAPSETELAEAMQMSLADYQKLLSEVRGSQIISYEDLVESEDSDFLDRYLVDSTHDPLQMLEDEAVQKLIVEGIRNLPEREKMMMALYYEQDLNLKEIGAVMDLTESRISQLHTQAVARIRATVFSGKTGRKAKG